jgi:hypothetical protein
MSDFLDRLEQVDLPTAELPKMDVFLKKSSNVVLWF